MTELRPVLVSPFQFLRKSAGPVGIPAGIAAALDTVRGIANVGVSVKMIWTAAQTVIAPVAYARPIFRDNPVRVDVGLLVRTDITSERAGLPVSVLVGSAQPWPAAIGVRPVYIRPETIRSHTACKSRARIAAVAARLRRPRLHNRATTLAIRCDTLRLHRTDLRCQTPAVDAARGHFASSNYTRSLRVEVA